MGREELNRALCVSGTRPGTRLAAVRKTLALKKFPSRVLFSMDPSPFIHSSIHPFTKQTFNECP